MEGIGPIKDLTCVIKSKYLILIEPTIHQLVQNKTAYIKSVQICSKSPKNRTLHHFSSSSSTQHEHSTHQRAELPPGGVLTNWNYEVCLGSSDQFKSLFFFWCPKEKIPSGNRGTIINSEIITNSDITTNLNYDKLRL